MPEEPITFRPLPWPPTDQCACGSLAAWEMSLQQEKIYLCSVCYQIETLRRASSCGNLLCDRIHRYWLIYLPELPTRIRSDGAT
jgi:hypothetical protein